MTFSVKQMTLRKVTIDIGPKFFQQSVQSQERVNKPNTIKHSSSPVKQNKNLWQNNKNFNKNIAAERFRKPKRIMNGYF